MRAIFSHIGSALGWDVCVLGGPRYLQLGDKSTYEPRVP